MTHTHAGTDCFDPDCLGTDVILGDSELCGDEDPDTAVDAYSWKCRLPKNHSGSHVSTSGKKWENENVTQGGVPSDLDRDVGAWESKEGEFTERELADLASRLIAERKELRAENADLVAAWRSQQEDLERKTAEWNEAVRDAATAMGESLVQISELQAENAKLCEFQVAAAEERIELRERLNEIELGFRHWRDSDWVDSDILRAALIEQQEPAAIDPPEIVVLVDGVALSTPQKEKLRHLILAALTESQEEFLTEQQEPR